MESKNKIRFSAWLSARWGVCASAGTLGLTCVLAHTHGNGPPCLLRTVFGIPCPGCGLTRSLEALWRGDLTTSVRYHPLGPPLFLLCWLVLLFALLSSLSPRWYRLLDARLARLNKSRLLCGAGILLVSVWLLRIGLMLAGNAFFQWDNIPLH